jgi:hypothetical protein
MTGCNFTTAGDARSFPAMLATVNSILQFHPDASITVLAGGDEPLSPAQRTVLSRCERVRLSESGRFAVRPPRSFNAVLDAIAPRSDAIDTAVAAWIAPGGVLCSPVDDVVDQCVECDAVVADTVDAPLIMIAEAGALNDTLRKGTGERRRPLLECFDTRLWCPREAHWQSVIDFRDGHFLNLSASGQRQRMFRSGDAHPFWSRAHRDRILDDHALQTYPYVWFLAMLWFGRCADWSLDPYEYLPEASRHLFGDLVHFLPQIMQLLPRARYAWNALSDPMITRALDGIPRCLVLGDSMSDVLALVDVHPWIRRYVEIGSYEGGSILTLALRFLNRDIDFYAVESFMGNLDGTVDGFPLPSRRRFLDQLAGFPSLRVRLVPGDSTLASALFDDGTVDCVFIDGCHETPAVLRDIDAWMPKLARPAIVAGDDYDWDPVYDAVNARFPEVNITSHGAIWWVRLD